MMMWRQEACFFSSFGADVVFLMVGESSKGSPRGSLVAGYGEQDQGASFGPGAEPRRPRRPTSLGTGIVPWTWSGCEAPGWKDRKTWALLALDTS